MRITHLLLASPLLLLLALPAAGGCGSSVVGGSGGTGAGGAGFDACDGPGQCVLQHNGCCPSCSPDDLTNQTAINGAQADAFFKATCPEPVPCPNCLSQPDPNLFAYCDSGHCKGADARTSPVSACAGDADCTLRYGTGCCEGCGNNLSQLIAVSTTNALGSLVCAPMTGCPACAPIYPAGYAAACNNGHCTVVGFGGG